MQIRNDALNVIGQTKDLYDDIQRETQRTFLRIARNKYRECGGEDTLEEAWLLGFLGESNPLTGYVFMNETDRKRQYYAESLLSGGDVTAETKKAMRYLYGAVRQYADLVTDAAAVQAYADTGVDFVRWMTAEDEKVCYDCSSRNGKIYPVKNVPKKPHYGCRCWIVSAENSLTNSGGSGTMEEDGVYRRTTNPDAFSHLPERMSKKHIRELAEKYGIDISGLTLNIDANEELLRFPLAGEAVPEQIGTITFFPNAFRSEEELVRTLFHEKVHVQQFKEYGAVYVQNNLRKFEDEAERLEAKFIDKAREEGLL